MPTLLVWQLLSGSPQSRPFQGPWRGGTHSPVSPLACGRRLLTVQVLKPWRHSVDCRSRRAQYDWVYTVQGYLLRGVACRGYIRVQGLVPALFAGLQGIWQPPYSVAHEALHKRARFLQRLDKRGVTDRTSLNARQNAADPFESCPTTRTQAGPGSELVLQRAGWGEQVLIYTCRALEEEA